MVDLAHSDQVLDKIRGSALQLVDINARIEQESLPALDAAMEKRQFVIVPAGKPFSWIESKPPQGGVDIETCHSEAEFHIGINLAASLPERLGESIVQSHIG